MKGNRFTLGMTLAFSFFVGNCFAQDLSSGYWSMEQAKEVIDKTRLVVLDPDISSLSAAEKAAADKLMKAVGAV